jgi:hypothetical protein
VFASEIGRNKDIFFSLFEILIGFAKEAEAFRGNLKESVGLDRLAREFKGFALTLLSLVPLIVPVAGPVAAHPALLLSSTVAAVAVAVSVTVSISVPAAAIGIARGLLAVVVR